MFRALKTFIAKRRMAKLLALKQARQECIYKLSKGQFPQVSAHELKALTTAQLRMEVRR